MSAFLAYLAICIQKANKTEGVEHMTVRGLCLTLTQNKDFKRADLENLKAGIIELKEKFNLPISPLKNDYIFDYEIKIQYTTDTCSIPTRLVRKILNGDFTAHRCKLLRYAVVLLSTFLPVQYHDISAKIGQVSLEELAHMFRTNIAEIQKLNKELVDMELISSYNRHFNLGFDTSIRDLYTLYEDRKQMEEYAKRKYNDKYIPPQDADKRRKLAQMYHAVKNGTEYDEQTMRYLYDYIRKQNNLHRSRYYNKKLYWSYRKNEFSKVRSLKPFTRYKYLTQKEIDT